MKSERMLSFQATGVSFSTEILGMPLSQKWWFIRGIAEFDKNGAKAERETTITAYRFQDQWFFTPPSYDERWHAEKITEAELNADLSRYLKVNIAPNCPLQLVRLSVRMDPKFRSLRQLGFDLRNKSKKEVEAIGFRIDTPGRTGSTTVGTPFQMYPGETVSRPDAVKYGGYAYYCEGESERRFTIDWVRFKDGSRWSLKQGQQRRKR